MRFFASVAGGILVALGLFLLMHHLIAGVPNIDKDGDKNLNLDYVRVKADDIENIKERRKPPPPEEPKEPPPPPKLTLQNNDKPPPDMPDIKTPNINVAISTGDGPYLGGFNPGNPGEDGDVIPIVRIEPQYPREAALDGTEGWVEVEIVIEADGTVSSVTVLNSEPRRVFDRATQRAVYKWKFKPRVIDGQAVSRKAKTRLEFKL